MRERRGGPCGYVCLALSRLLVRLHFGTFTTYFFTALIAIFARALFSTSPLQGDGTRQKPNTADGHTPWRCTREWGRAGPKTPSVSEEPQNRTSGFAIRSGRTGLARPRDYNSPKQSKQKLVAKHSRMHATAELIPKASRSYHHIPLLESGQQQEGEM